MSKCIAKDMEGKHMTNFESVNRISANTFSDVLMYFYLQKYLSFHDIKNYLRLIKVHQEQKKNISLITIFSLRM